MANNYFYHCGWLAAKAGWPVTVLDHPEHIRGWNQYHQNKQRDIQSLKRKHYT